MKTLNESVVPMQLKNGKWGIDMKPNFNMTIEYNTEEEALYAIREAKRILQSIILYGYNMTPILPISVAEK